VARNRRPRHEADQGLPKGDDSVPESLPGGLAHASADADLAAAQMALGRPGRGEAPSAGELESLSGEAAAGRHRELAEGEPRASLPARMAGFLRGSWRELQRVQWPDRQQVFQATGVVLGFVIVAGAFLGVADLVAGKVVHLIIK